MLRPSFGNCRPCVKSFCTRPRCRECQRRSCPGTNRVFCLERLRAHFRDLKVGESEITDFKLMLLGNGRVGKTQICRRLQGQDYDETVPSTHGVKIDAAQLNTPRTSHA